MLNIFTFSQFKNRSTTRITSIRTLNALFLAFFLIDFSRSEDEYTLQYTICRTLKPLQQQSHMQTWLEKATKDTHSNHSHDIINNSLGLLRNYKTINFSRLLNTPVIHRRSTNVGKTKMIVLYEDLIFRLIFVETRPSVMIS